MAPAYITEILQPYVEGPLNIVSVVSSYSLGMNSESHLIIPSNRWSAFLLPGVGISVMAFILSVSGCKPSLIFFLAELDIFI